MSYEDEEDMGVPLKIPHNMEFIVVENAFGSSF